MLALLAAAFCLAGGHVLGSGAAGYDFVTGSRS
jgi:hypothetical protein